MSPAKTVAPINEPIGCTLTPSGEYNGSILSLCEAAAMRSTATVSVASCHLFTHSYLTEDLTGLIK